MFTGIIEGLGSIAAIRSSGQGNRVTIEADFSLDQTKNKLRTLIIEEPGQVFEAVKEHIPAASKKMKTLMLLQAIALQIARGYWRPKGG